MSEILFQYEPLKPTTWAYLASLLTIALYFKFNRVFSIRNWDLVGLVLLAPALLMVQHGVSAVIDESSEHWVEHAGYIWLFAVSGLFLLRLLLDAFMVRRPLLEPNLSVGGLTFLGISLFVFLMANVVTGPPNSTDLADAQRAAQLRQRAVLNPEADTWNTRGPGFPLLYLPTHAAVHSMIGDEEEQVATVTVRIMAILSQLAIVLGLVFIGIRHFDNIKTGVAVATLYLLLPYTAMWTGNVTHALPGALLIWALAMYRRPLLAGVLVGLAFGTIYYPLFLLPLWISFYWQRGAWRFLIGFTVAVACVMVVLACTSSDGSMFLGSLRQMLVPRSMFDALSGVWGRYWQPAYRYPILAAHIGLCLSMALWPAQKNLATLISYSAAVIVGTQFWHAHSGGLALAWYLPMLLLTVFRPNLEDRVATSVVR
jgi:hypothetical protein